MRPRRFGSARFHRLGLRLGRRLHDGRGRFRSPCLDRRCFRGGRRTRGHVRDGTRRAFAGGLGAGFRVTALLLSQGGLDGALAGVLLFLTQTAATALIWTGLRLLPGALGGRVRPGEIGFRAGARRMAGRGAHRRRADAALGFDHNRLRASVAEALLDRAGRDIARHTRFQRQRGTLTVRVVGLVVFGIAHAVCFT